MVTISGSYEIAKVYADRDFCYDQVGDAHLCFEKEKRCDRAQRNDK